MRTEIIIRATRTQNVLGACSSRGAKAADPRAALRKTALHSECPARRSRLRRSTTRVSAPRRDALARPWRCSRPWRDAGFRDQGLGLGLFRPPALAL
jgi:hypothetical protein